MSCFQTIRVDIHDLKELPPLTSASRQLLDAINDPEITLESLCEILETNPPVTARLLQLANSAYFGYRGEVASVQQAIIMVLGVKLVKSVTLGLLVAEALDTRACANFSRHRFWFTAVATATLARRFCSSTPQLKNIDPATAYSAGLLHNIGLLALTHRFPQMMNSVFDEAATTGTEISEILQNAYSLDQHLTGSWLAQRWNLPEPIAITIREYSNPEYNKHFSDLTALVAACIELCGDLYREQETSFSLGKISENLNIHLTVVKKTYQYLYNRLNEIRDFALLLEKNRP